MKILVIGNEQRYQKYLPELPITKDAKIVYCPRDTTDDILISKGRECQALLIDPTVKLNPEVILNMPKLKIIQSEGVGYEGIPCDTAKEKGIYVCNCKGANAAAVAEQTILLLLGLLRDIIVGDIKVRTGEQLKTKETMMIRGIEEVSDLRVGFIGFGDIAKATAKRLIAFGPEMVYYTPNQKDTETENEYNVSYLNQDELIKTSDAIIILCPVTPETTGLVDEKFLKAMKPSAYLINTARGEMVDNNALYNALISGEIKGAALDTIAPIPVTKDNILLTLPKEHAYKLILSPHIGGVTTTFFFKAHRDNWQNVTTVLEGGIPKNIVNS